MWFVKKTALLLAGSCRVPAASASKREKGANSQRLLMTQAYDDKRTRQRSDPASASSDWT